MIKVSELWIGDPLRLKKSGRIGKFAGLTNDQKIKVKVGERVVRTTLRNVEHAADNHTDSNNTFIERPSYEKQEGRPLSQTIDLHMEVLNPSMINARPERIISYQVDAAEAFIINAIERRLPKIEIIHGKGEGVLKMEVEHLIHLYSDNIKARFPLNKGGSIEIWFITP